MRFRTLGVWMILVPASAAGAASSDGLQLAAQREGRLPGTSIRYRSVGPAETNSPGPLVVGLHGRPHSPPLRPFRMLEVAKYDPEGRSIVIAPFAPRAAWRQVEEPLVDLVRRLVARPDVDPSRVVVAGFSAGAPAAIRLAARHPDLFTAVLSSSGRFPTASLEVLARRGTRVLLSWSGSEAQCDRTIELTEDLARRGADARAVVFPGGRHEAHLEMLGDVDLWRWWTGAGVSHADQG